MMDGGIAHHQVSPAGEADLPMVGTLADPLYGRVRIARWAEALLATPPFRRLAGVSLSDVPGELLCGHAFPSRLDHTRGTYHLARLARPRDRALQAAALAHDLGHGPFSHLTESLMLERVGEHHEQRSVRLLGAVREALTPAARRRLDWLDWDAVARLILGRSADGRGALLNGLLDYDNADNVARFLLAAGLGTPGYDPLKLARALRLVPNGEAAAPRDGAPEGPGVMVGRLPRPSGGPVPAARARVYLLASARDEALAWQADRAAMYAFLHEGHLNLALHAMLRKAVDLAEAAGLLPLRFFDATDGGALALLCDAPAREVAALARLVATRARYVCVYEAEVPLAAPALDPLLARWRERLALETRLAGEAGLAGSEVIVEALVSAGRRALPPIALPGRPEALEWLPAPGVPTRVLHVFVAPAAGRDYQRRARMAAARRFMPLGAVARPIRHE